MNMKLPSHTMMIQELFEFLILALILFGVFLYFVHYPWFQRYADFFLGLLILALAVVIAIVKLLPNMVFGLIKGIVIFAVVFLETAIYLLTSVVPYVGEKASPLHDYIDGKLYSSGVVDRITIMREMMVDIIAEHDERPLQFETEDEYREELSRVKRDAETKLDRGESALSLSLGIVLLLTQLLDIQIFEVSIYGIPTSIFIELYLLLISISIIYRVSVLEYLTYTSKAQFKSLEKLDVALSYQKGVCFTNVVQVLMPVWIISFAVLNVDRDLVRAVLEKKYSEDLGITGWAPFAWRTMRNRRN